MSTSDQGNEVSISSDDAPASLSEEFAPSEGLDSGKAESQSQGEQHSRVAQKHFKSEDEGDNPESLSDEVSYKVPPPEFELSKRRRDAYQKLLDQVSHDVDDPGLGSSDQLPPSLIGATYWTVEEKHAFFTALVLYGQDDLPRIEQHVGSKTKPQIRQYLLLLRDHSSELESPDHNGGLHHIPAALAIEGYCEEAVDKASAAIARTAFEVEAELEEARFGEHWLIDEDYAEIIERQYETPSENKSLSPNAEAPHDGEDAQPSEEKDGSANKDETTARDMAGILKPSAFLKLSRSLFMNAHGTENWRTLTSAIDQEYTSSPAFFQSALEDLHTIVISTTQELVRATLLQAQSRLRANDDGDHVPHITESDARIASSLLGFKLDSHDYWATAAQRCGVNVYTESKAYCDGRETTKNGVRLTMEEVGIELGCTQSRDRSAIAENASPASTSSGDSQSTGGVGEVPVADTDEEEDEHLEGLDQEASMAENEKLLKLLGCRQLADAKHDPVDLNKQEPTRKRRYAGDAVVYPDWRKRIRYEAEWEWRTKRAVGSEKAR